MEKDMSLEEFINAFPLPQLAKVTQGYLDPENQDNEFATNDIIKVIKTASRFVAEISHVLMGQSLSLWLSEIKRLLISTYRQEKPTNCGTRAADVLANFLAG